MKHLFQKTLALSFQKICENISINTGSPPHHYADPRIQASCLNVLGSHVICLFAQRVEWTFDYVLLGGCLKQGLPGKFMLLCY